MTDQTPHPGRYTDLNLDCIYPGSNPYDIPEMAPVNRETVPGWLVPYRQRIRTQADINEGAVHFFLDDYRFRTTFMRPGKALQYLDDFQMVLTPDFSVYSDMPRAMQLWNVYRNRWCGCHWQQDGFTVIPSVGWGDSSTYDFAFLGLPERSVVAVTTTGNRKTGALKGRFLLGFRAMVAALEPTVVLCYGTPFDEMHEMATVQAYPDYWDGIRSARKRAQQIDRSPYE